MAQIEYIARIQLFEVLDQNVTAKVWLVSGCKGMQRDVSTKDCVSYLHL